MAEEGRNCRLNGTFRCQQLSRELVRCNDSHGVGHAPTFPMDNVDGVTLIRHRQLLVAIGDGRAVVVPGKGELLRVTEPDVAHGVACHFSN